MSDKLYCIACGKEMLNIMEDRGHQPNDGLSFHSYGHYGTTFFDPMDGSCIQIVVCDECLVKADSKGWIDRPEGKNPDYSWRDMKPFGNEVLDDDWDVIDGPAF
jgi:hypothetical protein